MVEINDKGNQGDGCDHANRDVEHVVSESFLLCGSLAFDERLIMRTEDFAQQCHARLREEDTRKPKHK